MTTDSSNATISAERPLARINRHDSGGAVVRTVWRFDSEDKGETATRSESGRFLERFQLELKLISPS